LIGTPDTPVCEHTAGGFTHYSIKTVAAISKRSDFGIFTDLIERSEEDSHVEKRQAITFAEFALTALIPATNWIDKSVTRCSAVQANDDNIQKESCGLAITYSVMFSLITGFAAFGVYQARRNIQQRSESDLDNVFDMSDVADWMSDPVRDGDPVPDLIPGYATTFNRMGSEIDDSGHEWNHYNMNHTHHDSGVQFGSKMKHNRASL